MTGPCGYVCDNKTSEGYCKTTACINPNVRRMLGDEITLTLNSPITDEQFDAITDVDMENTPRIFFHTKNGKEVEKNDARGRREEKRMSDDFIKLVKEMRETQKRYFKTRNAEVLAESKRLEREVDKKIEEAEKGIPLVVMESK